MTAIDHDCNHRVYIDVLPQCRWLLIAMVLKAAAALGSVLRDSRRQLIMLQTIHAQGVQLEDVMRQLRSRFGTSGIAEKASRPPKALE